MRQIRNSVFETNSSSMHSLVIRDDELIQGDIYFSSEEIKEEFGRSINKEGIWRDWDNNWYYGRAPFRILSSFVDKWKYAYASFVFDYNEDSLKQEDEHWINRYNKSKAKEKELIDLLKKAVPEITDFVKPKYSGTDDYTLEVWLNKINISLEEFLFNKKYIIICDGDEYCIWEGLKESGIIDLENIKEPSIYEREDE